MKNNTDLQIAKILAEDTTNITSSNFLKDLLQILIKIIIILFVVYISLFIISGIIIDNLSIKQQIKIENAFSNMQVKVIDIDNTKFNKIKKTILDNDSNFPQTSNLDIKVINEQSKNALCLPNGTIYITNGLYKNILNDEQLTFIIAHEMAHYKNKDHLKTLRRNIASFTIIILTKIVTQNVDDITNTITKVLSFSDLSYSRSAEEKADIYAAKMLLDIYGNVYGAIEVMHILQSEVEGLEFLSTHPNIKRRIIKIKKLQKNNNMRI